MSFHDGFRYLGIELGVFAVACLLLAESHTTRRLFWKHDCEHAVNNWDRALLSQTGSSMLPVSLGVNMETPGEIERIELIPQTVRISSFGDDHDPKKPF